MLVIPMKERMNLERVSLDMDSQDSFYGVSLCEKESRIVDDVDIKLYMTTRLNINYTLRLLFSLT